MKTGKTLTELAQELDRQSNARKDMVVNTSEIEYTPESITIPNQGEFKLTDHAHQQIAARVNIPSKYYQRMQHEAPELLTNNVRHWFDNNPEQRMVRTLDGNARAFLSDRYRRIDNDQIMHSVFPALQEVAEKTGLEISSAEVTDRKLYLQARFPRLEGEVKVGDAVQAGVIITNSEIGSGALEIRPMIYRLVCTNGMVTGSAIDDGRMRRSHLGRRVQANENYDIYSDDTLKADDEVLMLKIRDNIKALSNPDLFMQLMEQMRQAANGEKVIRPVKAVEVLAKSFNLPELEAENVLENLLRDGDMSKWGMLNAVTEVANNHASYDRAIELEETGGRILTLTDRDWNLIAQAA